jgi:hypothetical protein
LKKVYVIFCNRFIAFLTLK